MFVVVVENIAGHVNIYNVGFKPKIENYRSLGWKSIRKPERFFYWREYILPVYEQLM